MIYVPDLSYECYVVRDGNTIRAYQTTPYNPPYNNNVSIAYRDYYINSNYLYQDGQEQYSYYSTIPVCLDGDVLTTSVYYRNDFDSILIIFLILAIVCFIAPLKIVLRLFRRFQ